MTYGHAAALAALTGRCHTDPTCTRPALIADDDDPTVLRCAAHALAQIGATAA